MSSNTVLAVLSLASVVASQIDERPDWWCAKMTHLCLKDNLIGQKFCYKTCSDFLGGLNEANKLIDFAGTLSPCVDNVNAAAYCAKVVAEKKCPLSTDPNFRQSQEYMYCPASCNLCTSGLYTTRAACVTTDTCYNDTMCNMGSTATSPGRCSGDGSSAKAGKGQCECTACKSSTTQCQTDAECGGIPNSCANKYQCNIPKTLTDCKPLVTKCSSDFDCGGFSGQCLYPNSGQYETCNAAAITAGTCVCAWCPTTSVTCKNSGTKCVADGQPGTTQATSFCGHANFCVDDTATGICTGNSANCKCQCALYTSSVAAKVPKDQTGATFAPICIEGDKCTTTGFECGQKGDITTGNFKCTNAKCVCGTSPVIANPMLTDGTAKLGADCAVGTKTNCGSTEFDTVWAQACTKNTSYSTCQGCGTALQYDGALLATLGKTCTANTQAVDCASSNGEVYCDVTNSINKCNIKLCVENTPCTLATEKSVCGGVGKCMKNDYSGAACATGDASSACVCACAGCVTGTSTFQCGFGASQWCGTLPTCKGTCSCPATG